MAESFLLRNNVVVNEGFYWNDSITAGNPLPVISSATASVSTGDSITIVGENLGAIQAGGSVRFVQGALSLLATITGWTDTQIVIVTPNIESSILKYGTTTLLVQNDNGDSVIQDVAINPVSPREAIGVTSYDANAVGTLQFSVGGGVSLPESGDQLVNDPQVYIQAGAAVAGFSISIANDMSYAIVGAGDLDAGSYEIRNVRGYDQSESVWGDLLSIGFIMAGSGAVDAPPVVTAPNDITLYFDYGTSGLSKGDSLFLDWVATASVTDDNDNLQIDDVLSVLPSIMPAGSRTITFSATDTNGSTSSDSALLNIVESSQSVQNKTTTISGVVELVGGYARPVTRTYSHYYVTNSDIDLSIKNSSVIDVLLSGENLNIVNGVGNVVYSGGSPVSDGYTLVAWDEAEETNGHKHYFRKLNLIFV
ncbi:MAG: hypothetical protein JKY93_01695 [Gammaproteobacteria bacterium]|nr:hypothetical protein [Gammaproteobacteria bacterium]